MVVAIEELHIARRQNSDLTHRQPLMKAVSDLLLALRVSQNNEITIIFELFNYNLLSVVQTGFPVLQQCK